MLSITAQKVINAYGGAEIWQNSKYLEAEVSVRGLLFTIKRRPFFEHAKIKMEIGRPFSKLTPIGKDKNISGVLNGNDVWLENEQGAIIAKKKMQELIFLMAEDCFGGMIWIWRILLIMHFGTISLFRIC